ncbi:sodium-dependent transporter [Hazenella sp. IB182357]|uniref:Sodium-dependent transporter n=1 Tax=Polycladospora coralii TaxID=2771432 RepID=A0A926N5G9_9BACL|nr:sodium-dependent transporter [Polycladospora coralii]MBD1370856.1 sodium-dependent transporter [Polycladospora coralii]MBS7529795.1 sodium-dependent transporter [Polycladospora coralii]
MEQKEQWGSRSGFILAAVGSAIGLGNIWRYPYVVYENGGGAFLLPYLIALFTAAIPILLMEYAIGHKKRGSAPLSYKRLSDRFEWIGWWQVLVSFVIITYYMVIIGWAASYTYFSMGTQWGDDTQSFFLSQYLNVGEDFWSFGGIQWQILIPVILVWALVYWVLHRGVNRGIELASKILMPLLIVLLIIFTIRAITLPGAMDGLDVLFTPDFSKMLNTDVWFAAYGQVFFSLSLGAGIMITYSSYLKKKSDLANSGMIAGLANSGFEFLAAIAVFGALGFLAVQQNVAVTEVVSSGPMLAFVVFPNIINAFPSLNSLFGVLFFGTLVFAGFTSAVSLLEPGISAFKEKMNISRKAAVNWICGLGLLVSIAYTTRSGLSLLDIVDNFVNKFGILFSALVAMILIGWVGKQLNPLRDHINSVSDIQVGKWWIVMLKFISPLILSYILISGTISEINEPYGDGGYPISALSIFGYGLVIALIIGAFLLQMKKWPPIQSSDEKERHKHGA